MTLGSSQLSWHFALATLLVYASGSAVAHEETNIEQTLLWFQNQLMHHWLQVNTRPCDDFFDFVCNKSANEGSVTGTERERQHFQSVLKLGNGTKSQHKLRNFYASCRESRNLLALKNSQIYRSGGGWPDLEKNSETKLEQDGFNWLKILTAFQTQSYFLNISIEIKSNRRLVQVWPNWRARYDLKRYKELGLEVLQDFQIAESKAQLIVSEAWEFEQRVHSIFMCNASSEVLEWNYTHFKDNAVKSLGNEEWDNYFKKVLGKPLRPQDMIHLHAYNIMEQVFQLLETQTLTRLLNWLWIDYLMDKRPADCLNLTKHYFALFFENGLALKAVDVSHIRNMTMELQNLYEQELLPTVWVDEISQQNSEHFMKRVMVNFINKRELLETEYDSLLIGRKNFYRNLERVQRFKVENSLSRTSFGGEASRITQRFQTINTLLLKRNLTAPLNYILLADKFAEMLIASDGSSNSSDAWRSMDSEEEFRRLRSCIVKQSAPFSKVKTIQKLLLRTLSQSLGLKALNNWMQKESQKVQRLYTHLSSEKLKFSLRQLYFIGSLLSECRSGFENPEKKALINLQLQNSKEFAKAFNCPRSESMKYCAVF